MKTDSIIIQNLSLKQALGTIPSGLYVVDKEMQIIFWNPAAEKITGFSSAEAVGQHCSFLQGIPCGKGCGLFNDDIAKPIIGARCQVVTKSGETVHLLKNMDYLRNNKGEVIGGIESFTDISRQHALESSLREQAASLEERFASQTAELRQSETLFRAVLDSMNDLAYIATAEYKLSFMNRAMQEVFGDQVGKRCYQVLHHENAPCSWCPMDKILNNRTIHEERSLGKEGRIYEIVHSPLPEDNGFERKLAVCRDITERKKTELDLKEANLELDAFAHSISHDLRGILSPVVTYMDFLRLTYGNLFDEQVLQILTEVERQSERAIALLDDLLDLAQVSHVSPSEDLTDINMIVKEVVHELSLNTREERDITVGELPKSWLPETLAYQIFTNLLSNACNYVPKSCGTIEVDCWNESDHVTYFVRDHGPGIPLNERETIFDIFYRGKASKGLRGTGVGLAIVRKIALRCQGQVWVEQTPGGGATFCISLPKTAAFIKRED